MLPGLVVFGQTGVSREALEAENRGTRLAARELLENDPYAASSRVRRMSEFARSLLRRKRSAEDYELAIQIAVAQGRYDEAAAFQEKALSIFSGSDEEAAAQYLRMGYLCVLLGEYEKALSWLDLGISVTPTVEAVLTRSQVRLNLGDSEGALADVRACREAAGDSAALLRDMVNIYEAAGDYETAVELWTKLLDAESGEGLLDRAYCYTQLGRMDEAESDLARCLARGGTDAVTADTMLALGYLRGGDYARADSFFTKALDEGAADQVEEGEYDGDINIKLPNADGYTDEQGQLQSAPDFSDFVLTIVSKSATKNDEGEYQADGDDSVKINGNIIVDGINLILAGLYQSLEKRIEVRNATLTVIGTTADDNIHVQALDGSGDVTVVTGEGGDAVKVEAGGSGDVHIETGDDGDTVEVLAGGGEISIETGAGSDTVTLSVPEEEEERGVYDELGGFHAFGSTDGFGYYDDEGEYHPFGSTDDKNNVYYDNGYFDYVKQEFVPYEEEDDGPGSVAIDSGEGDDRVNIDIGIGGSVESVELTDENRARVHFTGSLSEDEEEAVSVDEDSGALIFINEEGEELTVDLSGILKRKLSDELENKPQIEIDLEDEEDENLTITEENGQRVAIYLTDAAFTNYIIQTVTADYDRIEVRVSGDSLLNQLIIDAEEGAADDEEGLILHDVLAEKLNLIIKAEKITVDGTIVADNIDMLAEAGTLRDDEYDPDEAETLDKLENSYNSLKADLFNVSHKVEIDITDTARIYAHGDVDIKAKVEQTGGIIDVTDLTDVLNMVNVKVASARIHVGGEIYAGYSENEDEGAGSIYIGTDVNTEVEAGSGNGYLSSLAVAVAVLSSSLDISGAVLDAANGIVAEAKGSVKATAHAAAADLPISLAVTSVAIEVTNDITNSTLTAHDGDVSVSAEGNVEIENVAAKDGGDDEDEDGDDDGDEDEDEGGSGGYFAVSVLVQDIRMRLAENSRIEASGDVSVQSTANAEAKTKAVAGEDDDEDEDEDEDEEGEEAPKSVGGIKDVARLILSTVIEEIDVGAIGEKLLAGLKSGEYSVKSAESNDSSRGQVSLSRSTADKGGEVKLTVQPKEGYALESITLRYLEPGKDHYTKKTLDLSDKEVHPEVGSDYYFDMPGSDTVVFVTWRDKNANDEQEVTGDDLASLFGDEDGKPTGAGTLTAVSGHTYTLDTASLTNLKSGTQIDIKVEFPEDSRGIELQGGEDDGYTLTGDEKAKVGDTVTIKAEALPGYTIGDEISYSYTDKDGNEKSGTLTKDENGEFSFTIPADVSEEEGQDSISFSATANEKNVDLTVDVSNESGQNAIEVQTQKKVDNGDTITLTPKDDSYYIKDVRASALDISGTDLSLDETDPLTVTVTKNDDGTYTLEGSDGSLNCASVQLEVTVALKPIEVKAAEALHGEITVEEKRIVDGEKTVLHAEFEADDGYRVDRGTVKAVIFDKGNEYTVMGKRQKDGSYTFEIPETTTEFAEIEVRAEFEMGHDDPDTALLL